jgi:uncharacterized protein (TIGR02453 family)
MNIPALTQFLSGLAKNNNRPWFVHNKPAYDILREEFTALVEDLIRRVDKFDPELGPVDAKKALFRIYRDVRFSSDKSPYKTHFSAVIGDRKGHSAVPGYYFQIDERAALFAGGGIYMPDKDVLARIRNFIVAEPDKLTRLLKNARFKRAYGGLSQEDRMTRPPKGFASDAPHIEHIKNRHFVSGVEFNLKRSPSKDLAKDLAALFKDLQPLILWLRAALR